MSNNIQSSLPLNQVVLPLVQLMSGTALSWSEREKVSKAIEACRQHWLDLEKERNLASQQGSGQLTGQSGMPRNSGEALGAGTALNSPRPQTHSGY